MSTRRGPHRILNATRDSKLLNRGDKQLLICQWNIRGVTWNFESGANYVIRNKLPDVLMLSEVSINYHRANSEVSWNAPQYESYTLPSGFGKVVTIIREGTFRRRIDHESTWNLAVDEKVKALRPFPLDQKLRKALLMTKIYILPIEVGCDSCRGLPSKFVIFNMYRH